MIREFQRGFEKGAAAGFIFKAMPKIFKWFKKRPGRALTAGFVGLTAHDVAKRTSQQVNRPVMVNQLMR